MQDDFTPTERAFLIGLLMGQGQTFKAEEIARQFRMTESGAHRLLNRVSRVAAICSDEGEWGLVVRKKDQLMY